MNRNLSEEQFEGGEHCRWCGKGITFDPAQDDYVTPDLNIHCGEGTHEPKKKKP